MNYTDIIKKYDLSINIINFDNLEDEIRIDSEYYQQCYYKTIAKLKNKKFDLLKNIATNKAKKFRPQTEGIFKYLEISNINISNGGYFFTDIQNLDAPSRAQKILSKNNLTISTVRPNRNAVSLICDNYNNMVASSGFCVLSNIKISPNYLFIFFKTKPIIALLDRKTTATMYPAVSEEAIMNLPIPVPSQKFQLLIDEIISNKLANEEKAKNLYQEAENMLLENLGLKDYKPTDDNISPRELAECLKADRFDAEYWQPKYDEMIDKIKKYKNGFDTLNNLINISNQKIKIDTDKLYNYIELADVDLSLGIVSNTQEIKGADLPSRAKMKLQKNDVIVSSVEGSSNKVALIADDFNNLVGSTGFFVFREKYFKPEVMLVLVKSLFINELFKREAQGTILTAIPKPSLNRIILPKLTADIQNQIAERIKKSHLLQTQSKELLEKAKKAVEVFIEKDEKEAIKFLNS